jgi:hypothetical protein
MSYSGKRHFALTLNPSLMERDLQKRFSPPLPVPKAHSGEGAGGEGRGITTSRSVYSLEKPNIWEIAKWGTDAHHAYMKI